MSQEPIDITPEDSVVPIYQIIESDEELAKRKLEHETVEAELEAKVAQKAAILERLGLTEEELKVVLS